MATECKGNVKEQEKVTDNSYSRNSSKHEFFCLMEQVLMNPSQLNTIVDKLESVINSLDCNSDLVKFTLEIYKNLHEFHFETLILKLFTRGIIKDESILRNACFGPFLSQLVFKSVTDSSVECSKYNTRLWIDRISDENSSSKIFPNPLEYLDPNSPTQPSTIPYSILLQFKLLDEKQRKLVLLDFIKIGNLIPPRFYPRLTVAFLIFLEFYKNEEKIQGNQATTPEICLWVETWYNLMFNSLTTGSRTSTKHEKYYPLHHVLNGSMLSTKSFEFLSTMPNVLTNVLKNLRLFYDNCSGITKKWVAFLLFKLESSPFKQ